MRALRADQALYLVGDSPLDGFRAKDEAGDGDSDNQKRGERKNCVISEGCPHTRRLVATPLVIGALEQFIDDPGPPSEALGGLGVGRNLALRFALRLLWISAPPRLLDVRRSVGDLIAKSVLCHWERSVNWLVLSVGELGLRPAAIRQKHEYLAAFT